MLRYAFTPVPISRPTVALITAGAGLPLTNQETTFAALPADALPLSVAPKNSVQMIKRTPRIVRPQATTVKWVGDLSPDDRSIDIATTTRPRTSLEC
jgi:hypothetical protein